MARHGGKGGMRRYVIFAVLGPLLGGFLLLIATTVMSGYWNETNLSEVKKIFGTSVRRAQVYLAANGEKSVSDIATHLGMQR